MARVKMIHAAHSTRNQPHSPLDNVDTPFDAMRLLRGAPPGRVSFERILLDNSAIDTRGKAYKFLKVSIGGQS